MTPCFTVPSSRLGIVGSSPVDVLDWIATAHDQATEAEQVLTAAVIRARQHGQPWSAIGTQLGTLSAGRTATIHARILT